MAQDTSMSCEAPAKSQVSWPTFWTGHPYMTVPPYLGSIDDADSDELPREILGNKLQEEEHVAATENALPPMNSKLAEIRAAHARGQCSPCAYFWQKEDGCRQGEDCDFCHTCDRDAMRRWKKDKKQKKKAEALAAEKFVADKGKKKSAKPKSTSAFDTVIGDPVRVNLAECGGLSASSSNFGPLFPYLPMELRVTPYQTAPGNVELEMPLAKHADMSPKLVERFSIPGSPLGSVVPGETLKATAATQDDTATRHTLRLYDMWPELVDNRR